MPSWFNEGLAMYFAGTPPARQWVRMLRSPDAFDLASLAFEYGALAPEPTPYPLFTALAKGLTIRGYTLFELTPDPVFPKAKQYIFEHLASGAFKPVIATTFPFGEIVEAHRYMESNAQVGKIVVIV